MNNNQLGDGQLNQLMRRFRNKKDLYRYLDCNLVSVIDAHFNFDRDCVSVANTPSEAEGMLVALLVVDLEQPEGVLPKKPGQELEGAAAARAGCEQDLARGCVAAEVYGLHPLRLERQQQED